VGNRPVVNIISSEADSVWGAVYEINKTDLDDIEGLPDSYGKGRVIERGKNGESYKVWLYFRVGRRTGVSSCTI